ncbi:MAG: MetQ/NlpA family ABC transporter substrate-binding protein [Oscillospiraceae bacterium]|nr:MetQ/NlpA family ABC transporter substrate-binding protein [Oscillospiraceae bacterium]
MKKRSIVTVLLIAAMALTLLAGCGGNGGGAQSGTNAGNNQDNGALIPFVIGATPVPHTEVLEFVQDKMAAEGIDMQIRTFTDFVQPNLATQSGELDANYFQHVPYMTNFNESHGTNMVSLFAVHFEPLGLYKARARSIDELTSGAIIAIPNDPTNGARALNLLEATGLITLREGAGILATRLDIIDNPLNLDIRELEAAQLPHILPDVHMAVINGNFALQAGLEMGVDSVAAEERDSISAVTYANHIVVREGNENDERVQTLIRILGSDEVRDFINTTYEGRVVPVF